MDSLVYNYDSPKAIDVFIVKSTLCNKSVTLIYEYKKWIKQIYVCHTSKITPPSL